MMTNALLLLLRSNRGETSYTSDLFLFNMLTINTGLTPYEFKVMGIEKVMVPFHVINFMI